MGTRGTRVRIAAVVLALFATAACCTGNKSLPPSTDVSIVANWTETRLKATLGAEPSDEVTGALRALLGRADVAGATSRAPIDAAWDEAGEIAERSPDLPEFVWAEAQDERGWPPDEVPEAACADGFRRGVEQYLAEDR